MTVLSAYRMVWRVAAACLSGLLFPLAYPAVGCWPLVFVSFVLLLWAVRGIAWRHALYLGMAQGMIAYGISLWWLWNIFGAGAICLWALMAAFTAVFAALLNATEGCFKSPLLKASAAGLWWTAVEFYRSELFALRFPWLTAGSALGPTWISPIVGVYGASFLVLFVCAGLLHRKNIAVAGALGLALLASAVVRPGPAKIAEDRDVLVAAVVQSEDGELRILSDLTRRAASAKPDFVVWPEYALPYDLRRDKGDFAEVCSISRELSATLILGTKTVVGKGARDWRNTALVVEDGRAIGEYYKARPVHFFDDGIPGTVFQPIRSAKGLLGTPICFDGDYSDITRKLVRNGAELLTVPSFDAVPWSRTQHLQHAELFRLRAAENARWIACAASSGVSQIIDPCGQVVASIAPFQPGVCTHRVEMRQNLTFFTRVGWLFPWAAMAMSCAMLAAAAMGAWRRRTGTYRPR